jgi:parallel beta-helix repeat protein
MIAKKARIMVMLLLLFGALSPFFTFLPENSSATDLYVGGTGSGNYTTIMDAADAATPGDTIYIFNGTYEERITISKPLSLVGGNRDTTIVEGDGMGSVVYVSADWVNISGLEIKGSGWDWYDAGIELNGVERCHISNNSILGNQIGIYAYASKDSIIANNMLSNGNGISLSNSHNMSVAENSLLHNWKGGIALTASSNNTIANNTVISSDEGISLFHSHSNDIDSNTLWNNMPGLHLLFSDWNTVSNNAIARNYRGVHLNMSHNNTVFGNLLSLNNETGMRLENSSDNSIYHNVFANNEMQAWDNTEANQWDDGYPSGGNYWSDYNGTDDMNGPGQDQPGSDGIGDVSYDIPAGASKDRYPLVGAEDRLPECTIYNPRDGATLSGTTIIRGTASFTTELTQRMEIPRVEIRIDSGEWIQFAGVESWSYEWNTTTVENGEHTIYARSFDGLSYSPEVSVTITVENIQPQEPGQDWLWIAAAIVVITVIVALLLFLAVTKRRKKEEE